MRSAHEIIGAAITRIAATYYTSSSDAYSELLDYDFLATFVTSDGEDNIVFDVDAWMNSEVWQRWRQVANDMRVLADTDEDVNARDVLKEAKQIEYYLDPSIARRTIDDNLYQISKMVFVDKSTPW